METKVELTSQLLFETRVVIWPWYRTPASRAGTLFWATEPQKRSYTHSLTHSDSPDDIVHYGLARKHKKVWFKNNIIVTFKVAIIHSSILIVHLVSACNVIERILNASMRFERLYLLSFYLLSYILPHPKNLLEPLISYISVTITLHGNLQNRLLLQLGKNCSLNSSHHHTSFPAQSFSLSLCGPNFISKANAQFVHMGRKRAPHITLLCS